METIKIKEKLITEKNFALVKEGFYYYLVLYGKKWINNFSTTKLIINELRRKNIELRNKELIILGIEPYFAYLLSFLFKKVAIIDENFELIEFTQFHKELWNKNNVEIIGSDLFDYLKKLNKKDKNNKILIFISKPNQNIIFYSKPFLKEMKDKAYISFFINKIKHNKKEFETKFVIRRLKELKIKFSKIEKDIIVF
jgi:hypothetical protein